MHSVFSVALLAAVTNCVTAATPTSAPTGIDYESMFQSAFVVPTSAPYNSIIGSNTGLSSSEYVDESRRRLESDNAGLRGDRALLNSVKNFLGASPSPAYRGWSGTLHRNVPHPAAGGGGGGGGGGPPPPNSGGGGGGGGGGPPGGGGSGGSNAPTVSSGWKIEFTGIPDYDHTMTQDDIDTLNNRPNADTDFISGSTTASVGDVVTFAEDIGYSTDACEYGYWPPGPVCPEAYDGSWIFSLAPAPETNTDGCYIGNTLGFLVNGVPFWSWTDGNSYNSEGVWNQLAGMFEQTYDMDICGGHSAQGTYHHHAYPNCLAETLSDDGTSHSPIYGFAYDSYPLYGPYQSNGNLAVSCWQKRDYSSSSPTGCSDSQRSCQLVDQYDYTQGTTAVSDGPDTGSTVTTMSGNTISSDSGLYFEDYFFNSTCGAMGANYLDDHNGHSHGSIGYHYHLTLDSDMVPTFPYTMGPKFYGCIRYGSCNLGYKFDNTETSDSTCGTSDSTSSIPGEASTSSDEKKKKLPPGAIVGIVIGVVAFAVLVCALSYYTFCRGGAGSGAGGGGGGGGGGVAYSAANSKEVDMVPVTTTGPTAGSGAVTSAGGGSAQL